MGGILSWLFGGGGGVRVGGRTDDPDPVTGLTSHDKSHVQTSWELVKKDLTGNGVKVLLLFFDKYPAEIQHFPFRDMPVSELAANKKFQAHCNSVMYSLTSIVDSLHDSELLVNILIKIGDNHKQRKVTPDSFDKIKVTILELFAQLMTKETVQAWDKALNVSFKVISDRL